MQLTAGFGKINQQEKVVICQHKKGFVGINGNKKATAKQPKKRGVERFLEAYPYQNMV